MVSVPLRAAASESVTFALNEAVTAARVDDVAVRPCGREPVRAQDVDVATPCACRSSCEVGAALSNADCFGQTRRAGHDIWPDVGLPGRWLYSRHRAASPATWYTIRLGRAFAPIALRSSVPGATRPYPASLASCRPPRASHSRYMRRLQASEQTAPGMLRQIMLMGAPCASHSRHPYLAL